MYFIRTLQLTVAPISLESASTFSKINSISFRFVDWNVLVEINFCHVFQHLPKSLAMLFIMLRYFVSSAGTGKSLVKAAKS